MLATKVLRRTLNILPFQRAAMSVDNTELIKLEQAFNRKINLMKLYTTETEFTYEQPEMHYDKKTGDVKIIEKKKQGGEKVIRSLDDLQREKRLLFKEAGLDVPEDDLD